MKDSFIQKLNQRASKNLSCIEVKVEDENYNETIESHLFYQVGFSYKVINNLVISFTKTWQKMKNKMTYTYLENYTSQKTSDLNYEPISLSIIYLF